MRYLLAILIALAPLQSFGAVIGYWKLDDDAANTTVVATTGTNAATVSGNTEDFQTDSGPGGDINYAFDLDGTADYVDISGSSVDTVGAITISLWFNADAITGQRLFGRNASAFRFAELTSPTSITVQTSLTDSVYTVPTMSTGTWYHLFITRTAGGSIRLWLNGTESSTGADSNAGQITIDAIGNSSAAFFNGRITQFRIFDSDESANVATYYAEGVSSGGSTNPNPITPSIPGGTPDPLRRGPIP